MGENLYNRREQVQLVTKGLFYFLAKIEQFLLQLSYSCYLDILHICHSLSAKTIFFELLTLITDAWPPDFYFFRVLWSYLNYLTYGIFVLNSRCLWTSLTLVPGFLALSNLKLISKILYQLFLPPDTTLYSFIYLNLKYLFQPETNIRNMFFFFLHSLLYASNSNLGSCHTLMLITIPGAE